MLAPTAITKGPAPKGYMLTSRRLGSVENFGGLGTDKLHDTDTEKQKEIDDVEKGR